MDIRQNRFGGNTNFENENMQFNWVIISIKSETSSRDRNTFNTYNNVQANLFIKKIEIEKIIDNYSEVNDKVYDLDDFDDKYSLFKQFRGNISKSSSTGNVLDNSNNREVQQSVMEHH